MKKENEKKHKSSGKFLIFIVLLLIAGGGFFTWRHLKKSDSPAVFGKLEIASGNAQCVIPGEKFKVTIRAVDNKGTPFKNCRITAVANNSCTISPQTALTDAGGVARFDLTAGSIPGDNYVKFTPDKKSDKTLELRFVNGIKLIGANQEGQSGKLLSNPVGIKLTDANGTPRAGIRVYATASNGAELAENILTTDSNGVAETRVTLPEKSGASTIDFEIDPASGAEKFRTVSLQVMSFNIWNITVSVLGGLALFMLGMTMMSDGLNNIAGEKMKSILGYCTSNRFVALLAGAGITAVIQSSSATTVMIIGFVNAGLMNLAQSIGVIFGANIGTTITAQIIAFNVGALALPAIIVGLVMRFVKRGKTPEIGLSILGFGLLFFGMNMMSSELKALSKFPTFLKFFQMLDCAPIDGIMPFGSLMGTILIGLIATLVMQSSSATTGIVVVLGAGGLIDLYTAVALILGANIGTTVTAQLAAIPANRPARQAALAHTLFNVIGVMIIIASFWIPWGNTGITAFFYLVNSLTIEVAPLCTINRPQLPILICPLIPNGNTMVIQILYVGISINKPQQLINYRFQMHLFGCKQRESLIKVKTHLIPKYTFGSGTCPVLLNCTFIHYLLKKIQILFHNQPLIIKKYYRLFKRRVSQKYKFREKNHNC